MSANYAADLFLLVALHGALAVALLIPYRWGGRLVLCQCSFVGLGAYTVGALIERGIPAGVALLLAPILGSLVGALLSLLLFRLNAAAFALVSYLIALSGREFFENSDALTGGPLGIGGIPPLDLPGFDLHVKAEVALIVITTAIICATLAQCLFSREFGRAVRALRDDFQAAHLDGISPWPIERDVYMLFGAQTALIGALWAFGLPRIVPGYFEVMTLGLLVVLGCIIAGSESPWAALLAMTIVVGIREGAQQLPVSPQLRGDLPILCVGVAYVLIVLFVPERAAGATSQWFRRKPKSLNENQGVP